MFEHEFLPFFTSHSCKTILASLKGSGKMPDLYDLFTMYANGLMNELMHDLNKIGGKLSQPELLFLILLIIVDILFASM